ncbi:hypothetical protein ACHAP3_003732 [Botrytis cinerea]
MDYDKPETTIFKCVVNTLNLRVHEDAQLGHRVTSLSQAIKAHPTEFKHADKPFGALFNVVPPPPEYDLQGNVTNAPKPLTLSAAQIEASKKDDFQPLDRVNASIGFSTHETERNFIVLRVIVPFDQIPDTVDPKSLTPDGMVMKLKFYANNIAGLDYLPSEDQVCPDEDRITKSGALKLFIVNDKGEEVFNGCPMDDIPAIVLKTPGFDREGKNGEPKAKLGVWRWELNVKEVETAISENLMNSITWPASPWAPLRVVKLLQHIMSKNSFRLPIYIMDNKDCDFEGSLIKCLHGMRKELRDGNPFRGYLSQNFMTNSNVPTIDSGSSIKDEKARPNIVTQKQLQYCTKEEMMTRLAVGTKQQLEDRREKIVEFCVLKQAIRLMKIVDDTAYYAFFMAPQDLRLQPGDVLKVNFNPEDRIRKEDWNLTVCESFDWSYQGESVGILKRPLVPLDDGATDEEKRAYRPLVGTLLPAVDGNMDSPESCRALLESARPISVLLNYYESEKAEARVFKALNHFLHSTRPNGSVRLSTRNYAPCMDDWSKVLLMNDNRVMGDRDLLGDDAGRIMENFNAEDQLKAIEYLQKTPVNKQHKAVGIIEGFPGVGKTAFLAYVVVCMLVQKPQDRIACICAANQPTDVLAKAIERAITDTCNRHPHLAPLLKEQVVIRVYPTQTETNFLISLADRAPKASLVQDGDDNVANAITDGANGGGDSALNKAETVVNGGGDSALNEAETVVNEGDSDDGEEDNDSNDEVDVEKKKTKKKRLTKRQRQDREVAAARLRQAEEAPKTTYSNYIENDNKALPITEEEYNGDFSRLVLKNALLSDGSFNLADPHTKELFTTDTALDMAASINRQLAPGIHGVKDTRFRVPEMSSAYKVLEAFLSHDESFQAAALMYKQYSEEGKTMAHEDVSKLFKELLPKAIKSAREKAKVVLTTPSQTATTKFIDQFGVVHALLIDEACLATLVDLITILVSLQTENLVLFGDTKQLTPQAPLLQGTQGLSRETSQDVMTYFIDNHWPKVSLNIQRRGCPQIMEVASQLFYRKQIKDAPVTPGQFPLRDAVANALRVIFPENTISKPYLYINAVHEGEIMDHSTKSWMNLTSAAVNVNLIEYLVTKSNIPPSSMIVITHYTAQLRVYRHAISKLAIDYPELNFSEVEVHTTDSIQGSSAAVTICDPVRTQNPGFTNNAGRNCVSITRATSFQLVTANTQQLKTGGKQAPVISRAFDIARKAKAVVNVSKNMDARYSNLLLHRHVHARIVGTEDNVSAVMNVAVYEIVDDADQAANGDGVVQAGSGGGEWGNTQATNTGDGGWGTTQATNTGDGGWGTTQATNTGDGGWATNTGDGGWGTTQATNTGDGGWGTTQATNTGDGGWGTTQATNGGDGEWGTTQATNGGDGEWGTTQATNPGDGGWGTTQATNGGDGEWGTTQATNGGDGEWGTTQATNPGDGEWGNSQVTNAGDGGDQATSAGDGGDQATSAGDGGDQATNAGDGGCN